MYCVGEIVVLANNSTAIEIALCTLTGKNVDIYGFDVCESLVLDGWLMLCYLHVNCLSSTERKVCVVTTGEAGEHILQEQMNRCADLSALSMLILVIKVNVHALCVWLKHVVVTVRDSLTGDGRSFCYSCSTFCTWTPKTNTSQSCCNLVCIKTTDHLQAYHNTHFVFLLM